MTELKFGNIYTLLSGEQVLIWMMSDNFAGCVLLHNRERIVVPITMITS